MVQTRETKLAYKKRYYAEYKYENHLYYLANKKKILKNQKLRKKLNPWISSWENAQQRCENPNNPDYRWYGKRGIKFYLSLSDVKLLWNRDNADTMKQPTIDRINNEGNYELSNCRFIELLDNVKKRSKRKE